MFSYLRLLQHAPCVIGSAQQVPGVRVAVVFLHQVLQNLKEGDGKHRERREGLNPPYMATVLQMGIGE